MKRFLVLIGAVALFTSCNEYQKVLKNPSVKPKYDMALKYYEEGDFKRANRLLEQIAPKYVGKPQGERIIFFFADSYYKIKDYNFASYQFDRFVKSYPESDKLIEASFLAAKSTFMLSPKYSLDQTETDKALNKLQVFINSYPNSEFTAEANAMAQELSGKKEKKALEIAKQYNKIGAFDYPRLKSAITAFDNFLSDYSGSVHREEALYYRFEASCRLAMNSTLLKRKERLENAKEHYAALIKYFPESTYKKDADVWLETIDKDYNNLVNKYYGNNESK
ncbi:outer membrane protein assembly factor BamD [Sediminicola luteus]|uniref:Outer membrane protein assembly factor BamD n=1 Tax=Sediminicola luteus TaxID=319238 RepID=A0A2A4G6Q3_9FLAO|nr:outer membrane protein assembly factor BamD [Sediminicola luteus]PCE63668.1 outer membrane protein assembly factor BamD [Sediminicola luteus]